MSTKASVFFERDSNIHLYEEVMMGDKPSPAYIQVGKSRFQIQHDFDDKAPEVSIEIPAEVMDLLALEWCKHRQLQRMINES